MTRRCQGCDEPLVRHITEPPNRFHTRRHCNTECARRSRRGVPLPFEPLQRLVEARHRDKPLIRVFNGRTNDRRAWYRARQTGVIREAVADRLSIRLLGLTLTEVYGHDYDEVAS